MRNLLYLTCLHSRSRLYFVFLLIGFLFPQAFAQTAEDTILQETEDDTTTVDVEDTVEKAVLRLSFEVFRVNDEIKLYARVRSKVNNKFQNTARVEVSFYKAEVLPENHLGKEVSNHMGEAIIILAPGEQKDSAETYYAVISNHPDFEDAEEMITVVPSRMEMELMEEDSSKIVSVFVGFPDESGEIVPLAEAECNLYVKRLFGLLPVVDAESTDEEGKVLFTLPEDIPGNESGNLVLVAKIKEHEIIGNVEVNKTIAWGIPVEANDFYTQRQLWSARANSPVLLIVVVNAAILAIWGVIAFIFWEIFRINKLGKTDKKLI